MSSVFADSAHIALQSSSRFFAIQRFSCPERGGHMEAHSLSTPQTHPTPPKPGVTHQAVDANVGRGGQQRYACAS